MCVGFVSWTDMKKYHTPQLIQTLGFQELRQTLMVNWKKDNCEFGGWQLQSSRVCGLLFFFLAKLQILKPIPLQCPKPLPGFLLHTYLWYSWHLLLLGFHSVPAVQCLHFSVTHSGCPALPWHQIFHSEAEGSFSHHRKFLQQTEPLALA